MENDLSIGMDRFIKSVPVITGLGLLGLTWQSGNAEHSNSVISLVCASVVFMLTALVYILRVHFGHSMMNANRYIVVMAAAALLTFMVLYLSLEYFYE